MISKEKLKSIGENYVKSLSNKRNLALFKLIDFNEGVLCAIQSKEFVETEDYRELLVGVSPFIIDRNDGQVFHRPDLCLDDDELITLFKQKKGYLPS